MFDLNLDLTYERESSCSNILSPKSKDYNLTENWMPCSQILGTDYNWTFVLTNFGGKSFLLGCFLIRYLGTPLPRFLPAQFY